MELSLPGKAKTPPAFDKLHRHFLQHGDVEKASAMNCVQFVLKECVGLSSRAEEESIKPLEIAVDSFGDDDLLNRVDCLAVAFRHHPSNLLSMHFLNVFVPRVNRRRKMTGRPSGFATRRWTLVQDYYRVTSASEQIRY